MSRMDRIGALAHRPLTHVITVLAFLVIMGAGYAYDGMSFVQGWGGGIAAVIATAFLVFKSQGYWAWMIVNASLWTYLFFDFDLPLLAWLQIAFLIFASYGAVQWALVRSRIGVDFKVRTDVVGSTIALAVLVVATYVYFPRGDVDWRWFAEAASVYLAIAAMWMDAFRYRANWIAWTLSNCCSGPLFLVLALEGEPFWGPFLTIWVYQALNVMGWIVWTRDERNLRAPRPVELEEDEGTVGAHRYGPIRQATAYDPHADPLTLAVNRAFNTGQEVYWTKGDPLPEPEGPVRPVEEDAR